MCYIQISTQLRTYTSAHIKTCVISASAHAHTHTCTHMHLHVYHFVSMRLPVCLRGRMWACVLNTCKYECASVCKRTSMPAHAVLPVLSANYVRAVHVCAYVFFLFVGHDWLRSMGCVCLNLMHSCACMHVSRVCMSGYVRVHVRVRVGMKVHMFFLF